jgi:hypothetical protein
MKRSIEIVGIPRSLPVICWKRYGTPAALLNAFFRGMRLRGYRDVREGPSMLDGIREMRMWAFIDTEKNRPLVHYWAAKDADPLRVAYMLGHEVGHVSGKRLNSRRNSWREELRADEYGAAAFLALREVMGKRRRKR